MNNNAWFKKEKPLLSLQSMSGGAAGSLMQGAASKPYVDDVFSTYLFTGNAGTQAINNGIDLSGEGGLVWTKNRTSAFNHFLYDTERGVQKYLISDSTIDQQDVSTSLTAFNSNGFTLGANDYGNITNGNRAASWSFRKQKGFFDIVTYTGDGVAGRTVSHNLGCVPGCIMIKRLDASASWKVYHRSTGAEKALALDTTDAAVDSDNYWNDTEPTASVFTLKQNTHLNANGGTYVAYLFAGGAAANTEHSVDFDGTGDYLSINSSDFDFGTGDFTVEGWFKKRDTSQGGFFQFSTSTGGLGGGDAPAVAWTGSDWQVYGGSPATPTSTKPALKANTWFHLALVRHSTSLYLYVDGVLATSNTNSDGLSGKNWLAIGGYYNTSFLHYGWISNFRVVKGTAVYTSSFKPQHKVLENISGTILLCCNQSTTTGSTITPATITANGDPTASTLNPDFIDSESFKFGEDEDQSIISCGSYTGTGSPGVTIPLGWEPQWIMLKNTSLAGTGWVMMDDIRRMAVDTADQLLWANASTAETGYGVNFINPRSNRFTVETTANDDTNRNGDTYIYMAIRFPDGYVGKPAEAGTDAFALDAGAGSSTIPNFDSTFPVDFAMARTLNTTDDWNAGARILGPNYAKPNTSDAWSSAASFLWDSNVGWNSYSGWGSSSQSWMWRRGQGFDLVTYTGSGTAMNLDHSLSVTPEMIWVKCRSITKDWPVYHKGLNGGSSPEDYLLLLNEDVIEEDDANVWNDTAPTATNFTIGTSSKTNSSSQEYIAMLFSSVTGISKVGSYTGTGSEMSITTGFQPRFVIIRRSDSGSRNWLVFDTVRGWAAGNDAEINLNKNEAQNTMYDFGAPTSTGFTVKAVNDDINVNGGNYIYYAHA